MGARAGNAGERLWSALQDHPLARFGFRRRQRLGPYIVDVVCPNAKLVILIDDGDTPADRTGWLEAAGYRVVTFTKAEASNRPYLLDALTEAFALRPVR